MGAGMKRLGWRLMPAALVAAATFALEAWLVTRPLPMLPEIPEPPIVEAPRPNLSRVPDALGMPRVSEPVPKVKLPPAPRPRARLLGTLVSREAPSLASFAIDRGNSFTMTVGELLEGWEIDEISQGRVQLHRGDEKVELTTGGVATFDPSARLSWATPVTTSFTRAQLDGLVAQYTRQVVTTTQLVPRYAGGQLQGLSLSFPPDSPLTQLGFKPSDLIVSTDGVPITPERLAELSLNWKQRRSIDVGVKRGDRIETLRWTVD
jgi:hypothetical protein